MIDQDTRLDNETLLPPSHDEGEAFERRIVALIGRQIAYNRGVTPVFDELKVVWVLED